MKNWILCNLLVLGLPVTMHASDESFRVFRPVDPARLERKVRPVTARCLLKLVVRIISIHFC